MGAKEGFARFKAVLRNGAKKVYAFGKKVVNVVSSKGEMLMKGARKVVDKLPAGKFKDVANIGVTIGDRAVNIAKNLKHGNVKEALDGGYRIFRGSTGHTPVD